MGVSCLPGVSAGRSAWAARTENRGGGSLCAVSFRLGRGAPPGVPGPGTWCWEQQRAQRRRRHQGLGTPEGSAASAVSEHRRGKGSPLGRSQVVKVRTPQDLGAGGRPVGLLSPRALGASPGVRGAPSSAHLPVDHHPCQAFRQPYWQGCPPPRPR